MEIRKPTKTDPFHEVGRSRDSSGVDSVSSSERFSVSIVIAVFNEIEVLPAFWKKLSTTISRIDENKNHSVNAFVSEVVFVDGNSTDGTLMFLENLKAQAEGRAGTERIKINIISQPKGTRLAYGEFLGIKSASGDLIIKMDGDLQHNPAFIEELLNNYTNNDVVIASRYVKSGGNQWNAMRGIISRFARFETHLFLPRTRIVKDPLSGFFLLRNNLPLKYTPHKNGFKFLICILSMGKNLAIKELPYVMAERDKGDSKIINSPIKMIINFNRELLHVWRFSLRQDFIVQRREENPPKFLIVSRASFESGNEGGADRYAFSIAREVDRISGGEAEIYFVGRKSENLIGTNVHLVEIQSKFNIESQSRLRYFLKGFWINFVTGLVAVRFLNKNQDCKVVNTNSNISTILVRILGGFRKLTVTYTIHDSLFSTSEKIKGRELLVRLINNFVLERLAIRFSTNLIAVSQNIVEQIPPKYKGEVTLLMPQGISVNKKIGRVSNNDGDVKFRSTLERYAIVAGYQDDRKRVDLIIKSWKFVSDDIGLVVVGNGPNHEKLVTLTNLLGLSDRVLLTGRISDSELTNFIVNSQFAIIASAREGFPTFIIESLKAGKPAIYFTNGQTSSYDSIRSDYLEIRTMEEPERMAYHIMQFLEKTNSFNDVLIKSWAEKTFGIPNNLLQVFVRSYPHVKSKH
ncbi:MAG: glycosyltransferase [Thermoplasmatales archaeon]